MRRRTAAEDRRASFVHLARRGKRTFEKGFPTHAEDIRSLASVLSPGEQDTLTPLLKKLGLSLADR